MAGNASKTGLVYDERMLEHSCIWDLDYPECPERFSRSLQRCKDYGLVERCLKIPSRMASDEEILSNHSKDLLDLVRSTKDEKDADALEKLSAKYDSVYFHPKTFESAMWSAGCTLNLVSAILDKQVRNGMAIVRPPGHHAMYEEVCGFCFYNNVAIAAKHAIEKYNLKRILIVDWDIHHGQATQYTFYDDPRVLYFSIHRYEHGAYWPELRESNYDYVGKGEGEGFNINVPLNKKGLGNSDYLAIFNNILLPVAYEYSPELIIVSSGYDAAIGCTEGEMEVTPAAYAHFLHLLMGLAGGRLCVVMEGGYCLSSLAEGVALSLRCLLGDPCPVLGPLPPPNISVAETICNVISVHRPFWRSLRLQGTFDQTEYTNTDETRIRHTPHIEYKGTLSYQKPDSYPTRKWYNVHTKELKEELEQRIQALINGTSLDVPKQRTCLAYDKGMEKHISIFEKNHLERPERLSLSFERLQELGLTERCYLLKSRHATEEELKLVHSESIIKKLKASETMLRKELAQLNIQFPFIYICKDTYQAALLSAGCLLETVDSVLSGQTLNGLALIRPPGHHADHSQPAGFCIFNNVAIAAKYAIVHHHIKRILIVDWDIHHGNGTQNLFYDDPRILYLSFHRYEHGQFYPFLSDSNYTGVGVREGLGYSINIPWNDVESNNGMKDDDYLATFFNIIMPVAYEFDPELVIISAGFDSSEGDPLGRCHISPECYGHMTHLLSTVAGGKLIVALEGGYNVSAVAEGIAKCTSVLLGEPCNDLYPLSYLSDNAINTIQKVVGMHKQFWSFLKFDVNLPSYKMETTALYTSKLKSVGQFVPSITQRKKLEQPNILPEWCWHLQMLNLVQYESDGSLKSCECCGEKFENWLCLHCFKVHCSKYLNGHMMQHSMQAGHYLCISYSDLKVWCYGCDSYIDNLAFFPIQKQLYFQKYKMELDYPV